MIRFRFDEMYHRGPQLMGAFPLDIRRACQSTSVHTYCWYMIKGQSPSTHSLARLILIIGTLYTHRARGETRNRDPPSPPRSRRCHVLSMYVE